MKSLFSIIASCLCLSASPEAQAMTVGGTLTTNTSWHSTDSPVVATANVIVPSGITLTIEAGTSVKLAVGISIQVESGGALDVAGSAVAPVLFAPQAVGSTWGTLSASGKNATLNIRHAELAFGGVNLGNQATGLIEDSYIHDIASAILANSAAFVTMRRNHVKNFSETVFNSGTIILAEDSLYENMTQANSDALEIQGGPPGSIIRRCTFRHSTGSNSDALDFNGTSGVLVQDCFVYDFNDKGISMGAAGAGGEPDHGIIITNCCIFSTSIGIAVKDGTTCAIYQTTLADCVFGLRLYQKFATPADGGHITNGWNNLVWGNQTTIDQSANSSVALSFSSFEGTNVAGLGNSISAPLFLNPPWRDYRLGQNAPARTAGRDGGSVGAVFPVGAPMALSQARFESIERAETQVELSFWADPERSYSILSRDDISASAWVKVMDVPAPTLPQLTVLTNEITATNRFYELVSPAAP